MSPTKPKNVVKRITSLSRPHAELFATASYVRQIQKAAALEGDSSLQAVRLGLQEQPFDFALAGRLKNANSHHSACVEAKKQSIIGQGYVKQANDSEESKVDKVLDPLTRVSWSDTLSRLGEDYVNTGNAFLEVVRRDTRRDKRITGLHHLPARHVQFYVEDVNYNYHFEVNSDQGVAGPFRFPAFGDVKGFKRRMKTGRAFGGITMQNDLDGRISEVIHIPQPSSLSYFYGMPDWLAAVASIELNQMVHQHQFDFHQNRGVPELLLWVLGADLEDNDWEDIEEGLKKHIGLGNQRKTMALHLPNFNRETAEIRVDKLAMEGKGDASDFKDKSDTLALEIVSAHRVPPLLAGIQIPGKLGATNELPNALRSFQLLCVGPSQRMFETVFNKTLGNSTYNGGLGLSPGDFKMRTIVDELNLDAMETSLRMREPEGASDRDLNEGLRSDEEERERNRAAGRGRRSRNENDVQKAVEDALKAIL